MNDRNFADKLINWNVFAADTFHWLAWSYRTIPPIEERILPTNPTEPLFSNLVSFRDPINHRTTVAFNRIPSGKNVFNCWRTKRNLGFPKRSLKCPKDWARVGRGLEGTNRKRVFQWFEANVFQRVSCNERRVNIFYNFPEICRKTSQVPSFPQNSSQRLDNLMNESAFLLCPAFPLTLNIKQDGRLSPAYFSPNYKYFDQLLRTVKNETSVLTLVFKEFLQTSILSLISVL